MPRTNNTDAAGDRPDVGGTPAAAVAYDPADVTKWDANVDPGNVNDALDQIAGNIGVGAAHDLLDGTIHPDTEIQDATEGSIIHGNAVKKWDEKVIGGNTKILVSDGTDLDWKDIDDFAADGAPQGAADYVMSYDATAGIHKKVLLEDVAASGGVTAGANITDHTIVRGDGGAKGIQDSGIIITDGDNMEFPDDIYIILGGHSDIGIRYHDDGATGHTQIATAVNGTDGCTGYISIIERGDVGSANRHPAGVSADPVLRVYSSDATQADDYVEMYHDQTDGYIVNGNGALVVGKLGTTLIGDGNLRQFEPQTDVKVNLGSATQRFNEAWAATLYAASDLRLLERSSDPTEPTEGQAVIWMSDGTGKGDDGDVLIASKAGGATKYATLFDHSAAAAW